MSFDKRQHGCFFTVGNPFLHPAFYDWAERSRLSESLLLEPFAGANSIVAHLQQMGLCKAALSYDIQPAAAGVQRRDSLQSFPRNHDVCVTNPPWLAKNSATARGMVFPDCKHDNLYKFALQKCLQYCRWVAALVPESFIRAGLYQERLSDFLSLKPALFRDTGHPVGLALFQPSPAPDVRLWSAQKFIGLLSDLEALRPQPRAQGVRVQFNAPQGNVGLLALDNSQSASIRFCAVEELADYTVKHTGRHITKIQVFGDVDIGKWNAYLQSFRVRTSDVLMTCYKGVRKDGRYRRRLDWNLARGIIHNA